MTDENYQKFYELLDSFDEHLASEIRLIHGNLVCHLENHEKAQIKSEEILAKIKIKNELIAPLDEQLLKIKASIDQINEKNNQDLRKKAELKIEQQAEKIISGVAEFFGLLKPAQEKIKENLADAFNSFSFDHEKALSEHKRVTQTKEYEEKITKRELYNEERNSLIQQYSVNEQLIKQYKEKLKDVEDWDNLWKLVYKPRFAPLLQIKEILTKESLSGQDKEEIARVC